uniref:Uncharacterized protein n=1 Tax=Octactis speculum TaxID=3111310 RepID=A0A7S2B8U3_9STRA
MAAFLGALPGTVPPGFELDSTRNPKYEWGFWPYPVEGGMHYQGRRWGGSEVYEASKTFQSYGVKWSPFDQRNREELLKAVPQSHKDFLSGLLWVHEHKVWFPPSTASATATGQAEERRVIAVHAGLAAGKTEPQLEALRSRAVEARVLQPEFGRFEAFSGRGAVTRLPADLERNWALGASPGASARGGDSSRCTAAAAVDEPPVRSVLISGHHGYKHISDNGERVIIDTGGGTLAGDLEAVVVPSYTVVCHTTDDDRHRPWTSRNPQRKAKDLLLLEIPSGDMAM